jgi:hypothetical protein
MLSQPKLTRQQLKRLPRTAEAPVQRQDHQDEQHRERNAQHGHGEAALFRK